MPGWLGHFGCWHSGEGATEVSCLPNPLCRRTTRSLGKLASQLFAWKAGSPSCWVVTQRGNVGVAAGCSHLLVCRSCRDARASPCTCAGSQRCFLSSAGCSSFKNHLTRSPSEFRPPALGFQDPKHRDSSSLDWEPGNHQCHGAAFCACMRKTPECQVLSLPSALIKP